MPGPTQFKKVSQYLSTRIVSQRNGYTLIAQPVFSNATPHGRALTGPSIEAGITINQGLLIFIGLAVALNGAVSRPLTALLRLPDASKSTRMVAFRWLPANNFAKLYWQIVTKYLKGI